jgi:beta-phosphoglucomutase-like phosphatase (HAD superfamily)
VRPRYRGGYPQPHLPFRAAILNLDESMPDEAIAFVHALAEEVPLAVCSSRNRTDAESILERAGLRDRVCAVVGVNEVEVGRPDPGGYLLALARLNEDRGLHESIVARDVLAIDASPEGLAAARAAGLRCAAVAADEEAGAGADLVIERLDEAAARQLLG